MSKPNTEDNDDWIITLRPLPTRPGEADIVQRMRRLLKAALRAYRFRSIECRRAPAHEPRPTVPKE